MHVLEASSNAIAMFFLMPFTLFIVPGREFSAIMHPANFIRVAITKLVKIYYLYDINPT